MTKRLGGYRTSVDDWDST